MNWAHVLELDSQTELLERLHLLTRFSSNLINVCGSQGAGKSWLAQRYLEAWANDKNQSLLMCHPNQDDEQRRITILSQLSSESLFNPKDSLVESFSHLFEQTHCDIVVVIDDAHLLSETLVSELWMWILESQANPLWTVNVVLFTQSTGLDALLTRLSYGQEHKPVDLEVEILSHDEADRLFEQRVMRYVDDEHERRVRAAYRKVKRLPGEIMALGEQKMEKRIVIRSIIGSPVNAILLVLIVLLLIGAGYWWWLSQPSPNDRAQQLTLAKEQTAIPTLSEPSPLVDPNNSAGSSPSSPVNSGIVDDSAALPPDVIEVKEGVGMSDNEQQRVVITSDVVDALLEGKPEKTDTSKIDNLVEKSSVPQTSSVSQTTTAATPTQTVDIEQPKQAEPAPVVETPPEVKITFSYAREELKAMSPRSYTLQLAAVNTLPDAQRFIDQYQLQGKVNVYPTLRNGVEWYIITYSNYPTIQLARDAVETLSKPLQQLGPWAKSLSQVHREIDRAK
ncbi:AAA family ATPase [Vibrio ziniensis]|uniref:AAA family ATPase n=1 Tax=Vibrio ziniensis TaxID=2711221 RepID=A0A6G7CF00_9VIBR|nr:AAA family ATPase [Vibrio ziniensis]QIH40677.1 AAA family ATPase [Vibrio ziniensis]